MANLVSPGFDNSTLVNRILVPAQEMIVEFRGLNRKLVVQDGEMSDMLNLASDNYPVLTQRKLRGTMALPTGVQKPLKIISKYEKIAMIAVKSDSSVAFFYDGTEITAVDDINANTMMVAINTKICFFPQKTYLELTKSGSTVTVGTYGKLEETQNVSALAVTISNEDARITISGHSFSYDDAINITGTLSYTPSGGSATSTSCNISCIIEDVVNTSTLVLPRESFIEMTGEGATNVSLTGTVSRTMPTLDHVIEWNNRLWGASNSDNTIYACKLGDPKNWQYFQGTSLDSFYAQQGTDGDWTGCATYSNHLIFFKPSSMCRIYGTAPSNFQILNTECYGVEDGSRRSVITINDRVFYKSSIGIMVYEGGIPYCISEKFNKVFRNVVAGTEGIKYYASVQIENGGYELMVLDIDKAVWHREDRVRFRNCCVNNNRLYFVEYDDDELLCDTDIFCDNYLLIGSGDATGTVGIVNPLNASEKYEDLDWMAVFGPFDEYLENKKIYSKISFRIAAETVSSLSVYMSLDDGDWELVREMDSVPVGGDIIQIVPRRCDRYSIKIIGKGKCNIESLTRRYRNGTFGKL